MPSAFTVLAYPPRRFGARCTAARRRVVGCLDIFSLAFCLLLFALPTAISSAQGQAWEAVISDHPAIPPYLVAVDKSRQELAFFERRSPLKLSRRFACTTGQAVGDKVLQGDLKTPEGIYFIGYRIGSGLDFIKYGHEAYTLNYPNPVDRLRRKTGYGIWIHGRGETLMPLQTEGCVSMNNEDLALLGKFLVPGAPVALTGSFVHQPIVSPEDAQTATLLRDKVEAWANAWSGRSREYFGFYDKEAYSIAQGEAFSAFQAQKERIFSMLPWIRTTVRDIQVLRGPDYWVTWFYQDYQAPNLQSRGVRRLYWAKDTGGEFKIIGMEWNPGLTTTLLASTDPLLPPLEQQGPVWPGDLPELAGKSGPLMADAGAASFSLDGAGQAQTPPPLPPQKATSHADHVEDSSQGGRARPSLEAIRIGRQLNNAPADASGIAKAPPPPLEAPPTRSAPAKGEKESPPERTLPPALPAQGTGGSTAPPPLVAAAVAVAPLPRTVTEEDAKSPPRPVTPVSQIAPESPPRSADPVPSVDVTAKAIPEEVASRVEEWGRAWQSGDIELYMAFYAPKAKQGPRGGTTAIRKQKERLWAEAAPATVNLADITVNVQGKTSSAVMRQTYRDSRGKGDYGKKTLTFQNFNGVWLITHEGWSPLPDEAGH